MKHLLFWSYFLVAAYILFNVGTHQTSEGLLKKAFEACKDEKELDGRQMYCIGLTIQQECATGLDIRICGKLEK